MDAAPSFSMDQSALEGMPFAIAVTNPSIEDNPIVFVNGAFSRLTGYRPEQAVGRNWRFLQGPDTDPVIAAMLGDAMEAGRETSAELVGYAADGTPFRHHVQVTPLRNACGAVTHMICVQRPVTAAPSPTPVEAALKEVNHRVKNHLSMVVGLIRMQSRVRNANTLENYATLARRIETLQLLYQEMTGSSAAADEKPEVALGEYVARIASTVANLDGRRTVRLEVEVAHIVGPIDVAAQLGLLASELVTNAYQHAFDDGRSGRVRVELSQLAGGTVRLVVGDDGAGLPADLRWPDNGNLGGKIVRSLLHGLDATLDVAGGPHGTEIVVDVPAFAPRPARPASTKATARTPAAAAS